MFIENEIVGWLKVTTHARQRWDERGEGNLEDAIRRAVPYGAQRAGAMLLRDGSNVFVINTDKVVLTVLTRDMAIANMQMRLGVQMQQDIPVVTPVAPATKAEIPAPKKKKKAKRNTSNGDFVNTLFKASDEQLEYMRTTAEGADKTTIDRMIALRAKLARALRHAENMNTEKASALLAVTGSLRGESLQAFYDELEQCRSWVKETLAMEGCTA